eukprot:UN06245
MDLQYEESRHRKDFGVATNFSDTPVAAFAAPVEELPNEERSSFLSGSTSKTASVLLNQSQLNNNKKEEKKVQFEPIPLKTTEFSCIKEYSVHAVNTEAFIQKDASVNHTEGGWPEGISQAQDKERFIRKIEADGQFNVICTELVNRLEGVVRSNLTIDLFKQYFKDDTEDFASDPPTFDTVCLVRDPTGQNRSVSKIAWHPENSSRFAVAYAVTNFEKNFVTPQALPSYIWDVNQSVKYAHELLTISPITCLQFNPKRPDELAGGCYNGVVAFWDIRAGKRPREQSKIANSHQDPVYDVAFIQSRSGTEFCSVSTDGKMYWWDGRHLSEPIDSFDLVDPDGNKRHGGTCLEYRLAAGGTKYMVGTENGLVFNVERKAKKDQDSQKTIKGIYGKRGGHYGPIYSVHRNFAAVKGFMTCGDWGVRMWTEEVKTTNFATSLDKATVNCAQFSPSRYGVFFVAKSDGVLDVWDYSYRQDEPVNSQKLRECGLNACAVDKTGRYVAVGDVEGSTTILKLSQSLVISPADEKSRIQQMFDREGIREKTLNQSIKAKQAAAKSINQRKKREEEKLKEVEESKKSC